MKTIRIALLMALVTLGGASAPPTATATGGNFDEALPAYAYPERDAI